MGIVFQPIHWPVTVSSMWEQKERGKEELQVQTGHWGKMEVLCAFQLYFPI